MRDRSCCCENFSENRLNGSLSGKSGIAVNVGHICHDYDSGIEGVATMRHGYIDGVASVRPYTNRLVICSGLHIVAGAVFPPRSPDSAMVGRAVCVRRLFHVESALSGPSAFCESILLAHLACLRPRPKRNRHGEG